MLLAGAAVLGGCDLVPKGKEKEASANQVAAAAGGPDDAAGRRLCASAGTYERLKMLAFEEARRVRGIDAAPLDPLLRASIVRMERPVVLSRDEGLGTTVCSGRFVLELPPGAASEFNGMQRLVADVEYSAQEAADGSGPVFQMSGAEPMIFRLASFGGAGPVTMAQADAPASVPVVEPASRPQPRAAPTPPPPPPPPSPRPAPATRVAARPPAPTPAPAPRVVRSPAPAPVRTAEREPAPERPRAARAGGRPSYNCRYAGTPSERAVCGNGDLAARDRRMSSVYFRTYERASPAAKRELSRSRAEFLRRRERCRSDECIASVYDDRIDEIRSMRE